MGGSDNPSRDWSQLPPSVLQGILGGSVGPSRPMWMGPVMEQQQLLATSMDPTIPVGQRRAADKQLNRDMLKVVMGAGGADITEPWQMTRAEFHQGKNLHGSSVSPSEASKVYDRTGFFTSSEESHADFYANSPEKNAVPNSGDIYAVEKPKNPLDIVSKPKNAQPIADSMQQEAQRVQSLYEDGRIKNNPHRFVRAVQELQQRIGKNDPKVSNALVNADLEYNSFRTGSWAQGDSLTNRVVKNLGHDALLTQETNQATKLPANVTIYMDRPDTMVSHRQAVAQALREGKPVPPNVLADYPDLVSGK